MIETTPIENYIKEPVADNLINLSNHIRRYHDGISALKVNHRDYVIDASCGDGYGSILLAQKAKYVIGLDVNESYLNKAKSLFNVPNLRFHSYEEYNSLPSNLLVDKLFCLETFEHISKDEIGDFIFTILAYIQRGGSMFLTVPIGINQPSKYNKYHLNEPSIDFLYCMFKPFFKEVTFRITDYINSFDHFANECQAAFINKV